MKDNSKTIIHLELDKDFIETVKTHMSDEFQLACKKWGLALNNADQDLIISHSLKQLRRKASENARTNWDLSDKISIKVNAMTRANEMTLTSKKTGSAKTRVIYTRDGWEQDQEKRDESVSLSEFRVHIQDLIIQWGKTAVFYGVASFSA